MKFFKVRFFEIVKTIVVFAILTFSLVACPGPKGGGGGGTTDNKDCTACTDRCEQSSDSTSRNACMQNCANGACKQ
jgi:hypothetical protein